MSTKDTKDTKKQGKWRVGRAAAGRFLPGSSASILPFAFFVSFVSSVLTSVAHQPAAADEPAKPKPEWRSTQPLAVTRGKTVTFRVNGLDLAPKEVRFDQAVITAKIVKIEALTPKNDEEKARGNSVVEIEISSPAELAPGSYPFKLVHEGAESPTGRIYIDEPLPEIEEKEPNDSLSQPQALPDGPVAVLGRLDKDGVDVFRLQGKAGESWRFEVIARRAGADFEPVLRFRDPRRTPIRAGIGQDDDSVIDVKLPADGPYLLELFDGDNRSAPGYFYRLRLVRIDPSSSASMARMAP